MIKRSNLHELHLFAGGGEEREVKLCLSRGNDPNMADDDGWTPLHFACYRREPDMCKLLIEKGASVEISSFSGDTSLHASATEGSLPCLRIILDAAEKSNAQIIDRQNNVGYNALMWTCAKGHIKAAKLLMARGADVRQENVEGDSALHIAAANNQLEVGTSDLASPFS
jgi:ankyrin repeat protein